MCLQFWKEKDNKDPAYLARKKAKNDIAIKLVTIIMIAFVVALVILPRNFQQASLFVLAVMLITVHPAVKIIARMKKSKIQATPAVQS